MASEEELIRAAIAAGLDGLAFTDHNTLVPPDRLAELNRAYAPFRVFGGVEIHTAEDEDVLVIGVRDSRLEAYSWMYADLVAFAREHGGYAVLAHPFRYRDIVQADVAAVPPDAMEAGSTNLPPGTEPRIRELARRVGVPVIFSSDAHSVDRIGRHWIRLGEPAADERELVALLRAGRFSCGRTEP